MAWADNPPKNPKKPSRVLGFLLAIVLASTVVFSLFELAGHQHFILSEPPAGLEKSQWVVLLGVIAAVAGWIISAIVTMRNSIRQHTVTTLLSSRLSETYMSQTRLVNARYFSPSGGLYRLNAAEVAASPPEAQIAALRYLLNYFEFIAVGIRYGDLDEKLLKNTLRGILCGVYEAAGPLVSQRRKPPAGSTAVRSKTFEHLEWLYDRWFIAALQRREELRPNPA